VVNAVTCAVELQRGIRDRNGDVPQDRRIQFRIGHQPGGRDRGRDDIYGDGVNVAARLEGVRGPGGIRNLHSVRDQIGNRLDLVSRTRRAEAQEHREADSRYNVSIEQVAVRTAKAVPQHGRTPSIAVLPFNNMTAIRTRVFSDGITEDLIPIYRSFRAFCGGAAIRIHLQE